jgi:hypothetical protein
MLWLMHYQPPQRLSRSAVIPGAHPRRCFRRITAARRIFPFAGHAQNEIGRAGSARPMKELLASI